MTVKWFVNSEFIGYYNDITMVYQLFIIGVFNKWLMNLTGNSLKVVSQWLNDTNNGL